MLATNPRRSFGMRDEPQEQDSWQGSLFAPDSLAAPARPPGATPNPFAGARAATPAPQRPDSALADATALQRPDPARGDFAAPSVEAELGVSRTDDASSGFADAVAYVRPAARASSVVAEPGDEVGPADYLDDLEEVEPAHAHRPPARGLLAGPTLDDVMSRVWEGLRAEVPTPCPVCHAEIEPSASGRCGACGSTLD